MGDVDDPDARPLTLYKRWILRAEATPDDVRNFVRQRIEPAYRRLSDDVELGLEVETDGDSIIAVQRWANPESHRAATTGAVYERWWSDYEPALTGWDRLVEFDSEWSTFGLDLQEDS